MAEKRNPSLILDVEKYEHYLAESDASEEEKEELLHALWNLICEFVTMGYGVHPVQQALKDQDCGQVDIPACAATHDDSSMVESENAVNETKEEGE